MKKGLVVLLVSLLPLAACSGPEMVERENVGNAQEAIQRQEGLFSYPENPDDPVQDIDFGYSVAIDGGTVLVGQPTRLVDGTRSGAAFFFDRDGSGWSGPHQLVPPVLLGEQGFGSAVAVSGPFLAVGSPNVIEPASVWILNRETNQWVEIEPPAGSSEYFGGALTLAGSDLIVADPFAEDYVGVVHTYGLQDDGSWTAISHLRPDAGHGEAMLGLAIGLEGNTLLLGAYGEAAGGGAYVFTRPSDGEAWGAGARLAPPVDSVLFGYGVAVTKGGDWLAISDRNAAEEAGVVHVFSRDQQGWTHQTALSLDVGEPYAWFGNSLAMVQGTLYVSAPDAATNGTYTGLVQTFELDGADWIASDKLVPSDGHEHGRFGLALAVSKTGTVVVAAPPNVYAYTALLGHPCVAAYDCGSGFCADGVCCDSVCSDTCHSCVASQTADVAGNDGKCLPVDANTDPRAECAEGKSPCGQTGLCDGRGSCDFQAEGTACADPICDPSGQAIGASQCSGFGDCVPPAPKACKVGFLCHDGTCRGESREVTTCSESSDCNETRGFYCLESKCVAGANCSADRHSAFDEEGQRTSCGNLLCKAGECLRTCNETLECSEPLVCHPTSHDCVPEGALEGKALERRVSSGCSVRTEPAATMQHAALLLSLLGLIGFWRRNAGFVKRKGLRAQ
jgi:MYXO-CTERM domain-containing protein